MSDAAIVLAAGKGTRMRSSLPKVLHQLGGQPMLVRVLNTLDGVGFSCPTVVVGYGADAIEHAIGDRCRFVIQGEQSGTGDALRVGLEGLKPSVRRIVVLHGDEPMIEQEMLRDMLDLQKRSGATVVLLSARVSDTRGFGRVIRDETNRPINLLQEADLTSEQRHIDEVNLGAYVFDTSFLWEQLPLLQPHPPKDEYYLTDVIAAAVRTGHEVAAVMVPDGDEILGVNDLVHLEQANRALRRRTNRRLMESGVTIVDSASTFIDEEVVIEPDTVIYPFSLISGKSRIGAGCQIGPHAHIVSSRVGDRCEIQASTLEMAEVDNEVRIGPYAHLRPGTRIETGCEIGNYAEIKGSTIGPNTKVHHVSYLGNARVGSGVNIGAGTITCNYDGFRKHETVIGDGAFIGSDTMLRAPVRIGAGSYTGAGSVVIRDVPPGRVVAGVPAHDIKAAPDRETSESS